MDFFFKFTLNS